MYRSELTLTELLKSLKTVRMELGRTGADAAISKQIKARKTELSAGRTASNISADKIYALNKVVSVLEDDLAAISNDHPASPEDAFKLLKEDFDKRTKGLKKQAEESGEKLSNVFRFCDEAFADGQELVILVTELTINYHSAHFISRYGCKEYFEHNKALLFYERQKEIIQSIEDLKL